MMKKALLVSDSAEFLETVALALKEEPFFVTSVRSADAVRVVLAREAVGVVVVDETIEGAPGSEFLVELHQESPQVPRLFLASSIDTAQALRLVNQAKVDRILRKPCQPDELAQAIRELLRKQSIANLTDQVAQLARRQASLLGELNREAGEVRDPAPSGIGGLQGWRIPQRIQTTAMDAYQGPYGGRPRGGRLEDAGAFSGPIGYTAEDPVTNLTALEAHSISRREKEILRAMAAGQKPRDMARLFFISVHTARNHIKSIYRKLGVNSQGELMAKVLNAPGRERYAPPPDA